MYIFIHTSDYTAKSHIQEVVTLEARRSLEDSGLVPLSKSQRQKTFQALEKPLMGKYEQ